MLRSSRLTVAELMSRLRESSSEGKGGKLGEVLAEFVGRLEEAVLEETAAGEDVQSLEEAVPGDDIKSLEEAVATDDVKSLEEAVPGDDVKAADVIERVRVRPRSRAAPLRPPLRELPQDALGEEEERKAEPEPQAAVASEDGASQVAPADDAEADRMLSDLLSLDPKASREDYFNTASKQWDMEGLASDLALAQKGPPAHPRPIMTKETRAQAETKQRIPGPATKKVRADKEDPEMMLAKLIGLDPRVSKEDYFDSESQEWDLEGLREDLALAQEEGGAESSSNSEQHQPEVAATQGGPTDNPEEVDAERIFEELLALDPQVSREDYFDESSGEWDMFGLRDDLALARTPPSSKTAQETESFDIGQGVLAKCSDGAWFEATVVRDNPDGTVEVKWAEDGAKSSVRRADMQDVPPFEAGQTVRALWSGDSKYYDAVLVEDRLDGTFRVRFDIEPKEVYSVKESDLRSYIPPAVPWASPYRRGDPLPQVGDKVAAWYLDAEHEGWYTAVVQRPVGGDFLVRWEEDGSVSTVARDQIRLLMPRLSVSSLHPGQKLRGLVTKMIPFGAYVDVGAEKEGLIHISKLSRKRVDKPESVLQIGQDVDVWLLGVRENSELDLSLLEPQESDSWITDVSPFVDIDPDRWFNGIVKKVMPFGGFVQIPPPRGGPVQIGLLHSTNIVRKGGGSLESARDVLEEGQPVRVRVQSVDVKANKMILTMMPTK